LFGGSTYLQGILNLHGPLKLNNNGTCSVWQARIDSHNKILYARHADQRNATFQRVLQTGSDLQRETKALLLRANLMRHDFVMKGGPKQQ
jgi:hypothetical protein